jgi:hypothetical protein
MTSLSWTRTWSWTNQISTGERPCREERDADPFPGCWGRSRRTSTASTLTEAADALRGATTDELAPVVAEITSTAQQVGISVLPATLDIYATVVLDHAQLRVKDVLSAAVECGSALLYLHHEEALTNALKHPGRAPPST